MSGIKGYHPSEQAQRLHMERLARDPHQAPDLNRDPELRAAWHSLQLHWLQSMPGYREQVRQRVAQAAREAQRRDERLDRHLPRLDHDDLGPEIEGCG
jgi:hypothetical protein